MKIARITAIIDRYGTLTTKLKKLKAEYTNYKIFNDEYDDEISLTLQNAIAETEAEIGQYINLEV